MAVLPSIPVSFCYDIYTPGFFASVISNQLGIPIYEQIKEQIKASILAGLSVNELHEMLDTIERRIK